MSARCDSIVVRLYAACLRLLPSPIHRLDGEEMVAVFAELWSEDRGVARRALFAGRMFARLPGVVTMEWLDRMGITGTDTKGGWEMTGWDRNLRFAFRTLRKAPGFTLTSITLIGLGIGAVTTIFTLVDHILLRPLPYPAADRLVTIEMGSYSGLSYREFEKINGVESWAAGFNEDANLTGEGDPIRIEVGAVTDGFFAFFGARPERGRLLITDDFSATDAIVVSHETWQNVFGEDPNLVGRTLRIDGQPFVVVGVLSSDFEPPHNIVSAGVDIYRPIDWSREEMSHPGYHRLEVAGRLAPGVTLPDVQNQLDDLAARMAQEYPDAMQNREGGYEPMPLAGLQDSSVQSVRTGLNLLFGAVGLLLLVACLNVAHLFLARGLSRVQEMAVRRALGAGAGGLVQQLLAESLLVGLAGGALGLGIAWVGLDAFLTMNPEALPRSSSVVLDWRVASFAGLVSVVTAVLFGLLPALRTMGTDLTEELKGSARGSTGGRRTRRVRGGLVVAEVALSLVLVAQAGLLLKSFMQVQAHDPGFDPNGVWTVPLTPTGMETPADYLTAMDEVLASLESLPGVTAASYGLTQPFEFSGNSRCCWTMGGVEIDGEERVGLRIMLHPVTTGYFETLRLPLLAGGVWQAASSDEELTPAVVTEALALEVFGSVDDAMGKIIDSSGDHRLLVVGVAADSKHYGLDQAAPVSAYVPMTILPFTLPMAHMAVRIEGEAPVGFARTLRQAVWNAAPDMPVPTIRSMEAWVDDSMSGRRFDSAVFGAFGLAGLLLATAGLYGTLLYNVRQQRRELGIRIALGAARGRVERQVVGRGLRLALMGSIAGVFGALWVGRQLEERLFEVEATDPVALTGAVAVLLAAAALASWVPARRAGRTDPLQTLKAE